MMNFQREMAIGRSLCPPAFFTSLSLQASSEKPCFERETLIVDTSPQNFLERTPRVCCDLQSLVPCPSFQMRSIDQETFQMSLHRRVVATGWDQAEISDCLPNAPRPCHTSPEISFSPFSRLHKSNLEPFGSEHAMTRLSYLHDPRSSAPRPLTTGSRLAPIRLPPVLP